MLTDDVTDLNRKEQLCDPEQVPTAPCKKGTVFLLEGMVLDFVTANFLEFGFTTHHLNNENIQITVLLFLNSCDGKMSYAYQNIKKCSQTNQTTVSISLKRLSGVSFESLTGHNLFFK